MSDSASTALAVKKALYGASQSLFDQDVVLVAFGLSTARQDLNDVVAFLEVNTRQDPASLGNRSRNEYVDVQVVISVTRAGEDDDLVVSEIAYGYLRTLERHIRVTDPNLGGLALSCALTSTESFGYTQATQLAQGRLCEIEATFTAHVRITG